ncbi:MAG: hypothetical protein QW753_01635 [Thermofilum sp.]
MEALQIVILAAVVIALSVAAALWLANLATQQTGVELLEIKASAQKLGGKTLLTIHVQNRGTTAATLLYVKVNQQPHPAQVTLQPGGTATITLEVEAASRLLQATVVTARNEYPLLVEVKP